MALVKDYLKKTEDLINKYGKKSIVLIQVGAFYEVYGLKDDTTDQITGSDIKEFATSCELAISHKNICVGKKNVVMAGFRDYMIDKYLKKLQTMGYTTAVWNQDEKAAGTTRSLSAVYSPGTYFSSDTVEITNNTMCLWMEKIKTNIIVGISNIDIYTGKSIIFEYQNEYSSTPDIYDELERYISIYNPNEIIIIHNLSESTIIDVINYTSMNKNCTHTYDMESGDQSEISKEIKNCEKQVYQKEIINRFFVNNTFYDYCMNYAIATQSYCFLLNFIYQHNPNLTRNIKEPIFENTSDRMVLANHSLKQLNMINHNDVAGKLSSIATFLNKCKTSMGKRKFNYNLLNPIKNNNKLNSYYDIIEHILKRDDIEHIRELLGTIKDIEKLTRKILIKKATPSELFHLYENLTSIIQLYLLIETDTFMMKHLNNSIKTFSLDIQHLLTDVLNISKCKMIGTLSFDENFIRKGYDQNHDKIVEDSMDSVDKLEGIKVFLNNKVVPFEKNKKHNEYVKIYTTEKMGSTIVATKRRAAILKDQIKHMTDVDIKYFSSFNNSEKMVAFDCSSVEYVQATGANHSIVNKQIKEICNQINYSKTTMINSLDHVYKNLINTLSDNISKLDEIVNFVSIIDFNYCKAYIANKYNYCKPSIIENYEKSFVNQEGLRHPLIENLLQDELYVTNDLVLDKNNLGVLLFGTNAVGKSSFIKALGISIIMAQSGFYVPCKVFSYKPFENMFTRILGNDNIFKGLSSFAVEMIEFKTILSLSNKNSIILGDELCSGTESNSAISIFLAGIDYLYEQSASFIFATHFHEVVELDEVREKNKLLLKHMTVIYDKEKDCLIYDRKLKDGPGQSMYGLEVCKSLHLPDKFLKHAHSIRNKYNKKTSSILSYKTSQYNSSKLKGLCEKCKTSFSDEVHHIHQQKEAASNGFIADKFHKNSVGNLMNVCEKCHYEIHHK